ncbi:MAG: 50S ribosomal protein L17 [Chitinophagales bacterium]|nr:50S ribosomal protein L17 [Bacteroidota bacterium]MCB9255951.1 50S ribosomal protein L17 [Chitinophagales bacterium]
MRHANKINHLGRKTAHRKAMLENMSSSLIISKRIFTTLAKAKVLRVYLEPVITKSKSNDTHNRRMVYSYLGSNSLGKQASKELFDVVSPKVADRPGGYLRIIKTGFRAGDGAEMAMVELVDFNTVYTQSSDAKSTTKKKSRRGSKKSDSKVAKTEVKAEEAATDEAAEEETSAE